jgi:hypothetical protein
MSDFNSIFFQAERPLLKEITSNRLNTILQEIRRNKPKGERGITVRHSGDGTYIGLAANTGNGAANFSHPFKATRAAAPQGQDGNFIRVRQGRLNNGLPDGMSLSDDPNFIVEVTFSEGVIYLRVEIDENTFLVTSVTIGQAEELPADTDVTAHVVICDFSVDGESVAITQNVTSSLTYFKAGYFHLFGAV